MTNLKDNFVIKPSFMYSPAVCHTLIKNCMLKNATLCQACVSYYTQRI